MFALTSDAVRRLSSGY